MKYSLPSSAARGVLLATLVLTGCGGTSTTTDGGSDAALEDRAPGDANAQDSSIESGADASAEASSDGSSDASTPETSADASAPDSAPADSAPADSASTDATSTDATSTDVARVDASGPDAPGADASNGDAASADSGGTCAVGGDYQVTLMGTTVVFRFAADGTWLAGTSSAGIDSGASIALGSWARSGGNIVVTMGSSAMMTACTPGQVGTFTLTFSPDCNSMRWGLVMDACMGRGASLDGQTFVRTSSGGGDAGITDAARDSSTADASSADASSADAGACTLVGDWSQFYVPAMMTVYYRLSAGGMWVGATSAAGLSGGMTIPLGNYAFDGRHLTLSGDPGASGCPVGAVGQYDVTFSTDCRTATLVATSPDTCSARQMALTMSSWNRL